MKYEINDTASAKLRAMAGRINDSTPIMNQMGRHMQISVRENFNAGGRPDAWTPGRFEVETIEEGILSGGSRYRAGATGKVRRAKRRQGRVRMGGLLVLTGDLRGTIGYTPERADLILWSRPEMNPIKAFVHQFGTTRAGRGHNITIPARPFLVFQKDDVAYFRKLADGWIRVGSGA
jgi:phage gpG-like protein